jgi:DJ-1 family protein
LPAIIAPRNFQANVKSLRSGAEGIVMAKVLIILAPGAEEIETITVADVLVRAGQEVTVASVLDVPVVQGSRGIPLAAHTLLDRVAHDTFDLVYVPGGGGGAEYCTNDSRVQDLIERQLSSQNTLAIMCASPTALVPRGLAKGRTLTCYPGMRARVEPHAGKWVDQAVVADGNLMTSQGPGTAMQFALALAKHLAGQAVADRVAKDMLVKSTTSAQA